MVSGVISLMLDVFVLRAGEISCSKVCSIGWRFPKRRLRAKNMFLVSMQDTFVLRAGELPWLNISSIFHSKITRIGFFKNVPQLFFSKDWRLGMGLGLDAFVLKAGEVYWLKIRSIGLRFEQLVEDSINWLKIKINWLNICPNDRRFTKRCHQAEGMFIILMQYTFVLRAGEPSWLKIAKILLFKNVPQLFSEKTGIGEISV